MNPRLASMAVLCREGAIPALVLAWIAAFGSAGIDHTRAAPIVARVAPLLTADAKFADKTPPVVTQPIVAAAASVIPATISVAEAPALAPAPAPKEPDPVVTASLTDPSEVLRPETPADPTVQTSKATEEPGNSGAAVESAKTPDDCSDNCIDSYLWTLYERTPKEDSVKEHEQRQVTVKKKGKLVTVTRTVTKIADEDFAWKDFKAAENAGMPVPDYVIGGMDREFKQKLFHLLRAADDAGLSPGITSAFRDDYRQSIASGLKAANDRSYHGGSSRGGYGHGIAADIVGVKGATRAERLASSQILWKWVDDHEKEFGIGRPYLNRDPPHVASIDGKEYADHHPHMRVRRAVAAAKPANGVASPNTASKPLRTARSS
jgi:D-alanyl-D-alanine carboxypeptidase